MNETILDRIACLCEAIRNCKKAGNVEWEARHRERLEFYVSEYLPSGCGFDAGCTVDEARSGLDAVWVSTAFHHVNENGFYDGWTTHVLRIVPRFHLGPSVSSISGREYGNGSKEYIAEAVLQACTQAAPDRSLEPVV